MSVGNKPLFDAYRNVGQVLGKHLFIQQSPVVSIITTSSNSYKIYDSELKIRNISPVFPQDITGIYSYSNSTYVRCGTKLIKMSYSHIVKEWEIGHEAVDSHILIFGDLIILGEKTKLILIDDENVEVIEIGFRIKGIFHPITYVNKIVIFGMHNIELWNVVTKYKVYDFSPSFEGRIFSVVGSPKVDVVGILNEKKILLFNLKTAKVLFELVQKETSQCLTFSQHGVPLLATSDKFGTIKVWSLNSKSIIGVLKAHEGSIDYLQFLPGELTIVSGSVQDNSIKQWKYDESEAQQFRKLRERNGLKNPIQIMSLQSNTDLIITSSDQTMYLSLISDNNNYILPKCMDSLLPTHIAKNGNKLNVYKNQTKTKSFNVKKNFQIAKISNSQNYYFVVLDNQIMRFGGGTQIEWSFENEVKDIIVNQPYYIFSLNRTSQLFCIPFRHQGGDISEFSDGVQRIEDIGNLQVSLDRKYIAYSKYDEDIFQYCIYLLNTRTLETTKRVMEQSYDSLSFTQDNRFLLLATKSTNSLVILDVLHNIIYKTYNLNKHMIAHQTTPDGSFLLTVFEGERKVNVWNNFLGVVPVSEGEENLEFKTDIVKLPHDLRQYLNGIEVKHTYNNNVYEDIEAQLDQIPDANQTISFTEQPLSQWVPLIHYEQIKERNRPVAVAEKKVEAPFFLDSETKTNFINKMNQQHQQQLETQSRILNEKQYKLMEQNSKKIRFNSTLSQSQRHEEYDILMQTLKSLSLAELDYELNTLVFDPLNISHTAKFFEYILTKHEDYDIKIVYYYRFLTLLGTSTIQNQSINNQIKDWRSMSKLYEYTSEVCERLANKE